MTKCGWRITRLLSLLVPTLLMTVACCHVGTLAPDKMRTAMLVSARPSPEVGLIPPSGWTVAGYHVVADPSTCPTDKEQIEKSLGIVDAQACGELRQQAAPTTGDGDAPLPKPAAPHCYALGDNILLVQYEVARQNCTRVVGLGVFPRQK